MKRVQSSISTTNIDFATFKYTSTMVFRPVTESEYSNYKRELIFYQTPMQYSAYVYYSEHTQRSSTMPLSAQSIKRDQEALVKLSACCSNL